MPTRVGNYSFKLVRLVGCDLYETNNEKFSLRKISKKICAYPGGLDEICCRAFWRWAIIWWKLRGWNEKLSIICMNRKWGDENAEWGGILLLIMWALLCRRVRVWCTHSACCEITVCDPAQYMTSTALPCSPRFYTVHRRGLASPVLQTAAASTPSWRNLNVWGTATPTHRQLPTCSQQRMTLCLNVW